MAVVHFYRAYPNQQKAILKRFGTEPEPYEWSEQDISVQIMYKYQYIFHF